MLEHLRGKCKQSFGESCAIYFSNWRGRCSFLCADEIKEYNGPKITWRVLLFCTSALLFFSFFKKKLSICMLLCVSSSFDSIKFLSSIGEF